MDNLMKKRILGQVKAENSDFNALFYPSTFFLRTAKYFFIVNLV
jgi:hypothetical protein